MAGDEFHWGDEIQWPTSKYFVALVVQKEMTAERLNIS